jgi:hypothetical protein
VTVWVAEYEDLHAVERQFITRTRPGCSVIVRADADPAVDPDGRYLVLWWDGSRVWRWQGDDVEAWEAVWRGWHYGHHALAP